MYYNTLFTRLNEMIALTLDHGDSCSSRSECMLNVICIHIKTVLLEYIINSIKFIFFVFLTNSLSTTSLIFYSQDKMLII